MKRFKIARWCLCVLILIVWGRVAFASGQNLMIVGGNQSPGNFPDLNGKPIGLMVDVVGEIHKRLGITGEIRLLPWARAFDIAKKQPNVVILSLARTPEREDQFHWIMLVMRKPWVFYAKRGSGIGKIIKSLDDAKKVKLIGVLRGDIRADWLKSQGFANLEEVTDVTQNIQKLYLGRVPLIFTSPEDAAESCKKLGLNMRDLEPVMIPNSSHSYIAMSKNGTSLEIVKKWQKVGQQMKNDGTFQQLAKKWARYTQEQLGVDCQVKDGALNFWK